MSLNKGVRKLVDEEYVKYLREMIREVIRRRIHDKMLEAVERAVAIVITDEHIKVTVDEWAESAKLITEDKIK